MPGWLLLSPQRAAASFQSKLLWVHENTLKPVAMAKHYMATVQRNEVHPDHCPCGELLRALPGLHQCLGGEAAAIVLSVPKYCPLCRVPSIRLEGRAVMSLWCDTATGTPSTPFPGSYCSMGKGGSRFHNCL